MQSALVIPDENMPLSVKAKGLMLYSISLVAFHEERLAALDARFKEGTSLMEGPNKDHAAKARLIAEIDARTLRAEAKNAGMSPAVYEAMITRSIDAARDAAASVRPGETPDRKKFYPWV